MTFLRAERHTHWVIVLVVCATLTIPFVKLFPHAGLPAWLGVFGIVPFVAPIFLWLLFLWPLAFKRWPGDPA
ncbi:hypothetical protein [Dokdonella sp.]|uniref:hypothetical protein n=1 Tax=Dokdonella sp. TaxID=2291710 RepID=UPI001B123CAC|nr:hypothetical protein [Dokdonella sp.]MBO9661591.1 hypothetical protein [Dokdonella sp.]